MACLPGRPARQRLRNIAACAGSPHTISRPCSGDGRAAESGVPFLRRLKTLDVNLHRYRDRYRLPASVEKELNLNFHEKLSVDGSVCDGRDIKCVSRCITKPSTLFNGRLIQQDEARPLIPSTRAARKIAIRMRRYARWKVDSWPDTPGDGWFPQPAPKKPSVEKPAPPRMTPMSPDLRCPHRPIRRRHARDSRVMVREAAIARNISSSTAGQ